jgi:CBS domain containing-hemolysin-like protein
MSAQIELFALRRDLGPPRGGSWRVDPSDPARTVMTDFADTGMITVAPTLKIDAALDVMRFAGVRSAFVMSEDRRLVLGLVTAYDILGEKPLRFLQATRGSHEDVLVQDIMERSADWLVASWADLERATVQTMLDAFRKTGRTHIAVVEELEGRQPALRGIFSAAKLLRLTRAAH